MSVTQLKECREKVGKETQAIMESTLRRSYPEKWETELVQPQIMLQNELIIACLITIADQLERVG